MRLTRTTEESEGPNLTPVIDVVFLLLIFFLVASRFAEDEREIDTRLPAVVHARPLAGGERQIIINVGASGVYKIAGQEYSDRQLETLLREERTKNPGMQTVQIRADERVAFKYVARVMGLCEQERIRHSCAVTQDQ